tara:strand:- start:60321 stop:61499 length:1179 start_codon:yes stop_codon:yes gene_type:complete
MPNGDNRSPLPLQAVQVPRLFDGEKWRHDYCVIMQGECVVEVLPASSRPSTLPCTVLAEGTLAPGLIDLQVNGGGGVLFNNAPSAATILQIAQAHRHRGTTSLLPTVMSDTPQTMRAAVDAVREVRAAEHGEIAGIHIEGPFFNPLKRGAHHADAIRAPEQDDIDWLCGLTDIPVLLTLAPEMLSAAQLQQLKAAGILISAGHTDASYAQMAAAAANGLSGVTHLFNAMRPGSAREPGAVGAALDISTLWASVIADGHHVHAANLRLAQASKAPGGLLLVSDAMATSDSSDKQFTLYGEPLQEVDGRIVNGDGVLAGSAITLLDAVHFASEHAGIALAECLRMASLYPAIVLQTDHVMGRIAAGYRADLVHFDDDFNVLGTWVAGEPQSHQA